MTLGHKRSFPEWQATRYAQADKMPPLALRATRALGVRGEIALSHSHIHRHLLVPLQEFCIHSLHCWGSALSLQCDVTWRHKNRVIQQPTNSKVIYNSAHSMVYNRVKPVGNYCHCWVVVVLPIQIGLYSFKCKSLQALISFISFELKSHLAGLNNDLMDRGKH